MQHLLHTVGTLSLSPSLTLCFTLSLSLHLTLCFSLSLSLHLHLSLSLTLPFTQALFLPQCRLQRHRQVWMWGLLASCSSQGLVNTHL